VKTGREQIIEGDKVRRNGELLDKLLYSNRPYKIDIGWTVKRKLQDGDYVLLNRQPTLHKASMMSMKVVRKPYKTLRMNLAVTKPFNADFDGDEMNIHVPQTLESQAELKDISAAQWNIISAQSSKPNIAIVQDSLLGAYRMTLGIQKITKAQFFNVTEKLQLDEPVLDRIDHIRNVYKQKGKKIPCFSGKGLMSLFLPRDFNYEKKNSADPKEPIVRIYQGVLYEGVYSKDILGSAHNSLLQVVNKEYGAVACSHFVDCIQFVTNAWNLLNLFTVGLGDCLVASEDKEEEIQDVIKKCYIEAEGIKTTTTHPGIREMRVNAALSKAKDIGLRIAKDSLGDDNNFLSTVISGSKGDFFNIAQITGLLGQQNLKGQRVPLLLNHGKRTLPHYPFGEMSPEMEYESRGFIASSFIKGLNPREFYFHAMSGREGISDTAMGTATSGYMQRRIIKLTEDIKVQYDGTVRDITGTIYQVAYGNNGIDPTCTVKVKGEQEVCDISRMIEKLNMEHEQSKK
jgi:DNA-directed RNA polymerase beta' subunit